LRSDEFHIDRYAVTNEEFARFVDATGYVTVAERPPDPADFPGAPAENLVPGSMVFVGTPGPVDLRHINLWWCWTPGASWHHPEGPGSDVAGRPDHPVVQVRLRGRAGVLQLGGCEPADRGAVGGGRPRWPRGRGLRLG
jgi:formylglycine-generating enzyme required for sulfatase activity